VEPDCGLGRGRDLIVADAAPIHTVVVRGAAVAQRNPVVLVQTVPAVRAVAEWGLFHITQSVTGNQVGKSPSIHALKTATWPSDQAPSHGIEPASTRS
jgi:hypothetical protein